MDQDALITSITGQLDALQLLVKTGVGLALIAGWYALQNSDEVSIGTLKVKRQYAFPVLSGVFIVLNFSSIVYFLRVADLITMVTDPDRLKKALTVLFTHKWALSPFSYYGDSGWAMWYSSFGFGLLIIVWWIGATTLALLSNYKRTGFTVLGVVFLIVGLLSMASIINDYYTIHAKLASLSNYSLTPSIERAGNYKRNVTIAFSILGPIIFIIGWIIQPKRVDERAAASNAARGGEIAERHSIPETDRAGYANRLD